MKKIFQTFMLLLFPLLFIAGCSIPTPVKNIADTAELSQALAEEECSIVFGRIKWIEDGKVMKLGDGILPLPFVSPHLTKMDDKAYIVGKVQEDGVFIWSLKTGTYMMHKIRYRDPWTGENFVVPKVAFRVPEKGNIFYVGTLKGEFEPNRWKGFWTGSLGNVTFSIQDECDTDCVNFQNKLNIESEKIKKSIMIIDPRLPRSIETMEEYRLAIGILNVILGGMSLSH